MAHTPEPWEIGTQTRGSEICTIHGVTRRPSDDGCGQGWVYIHYPRVIDGKYHYPDEAENDANARRIVACVNALSGISTEAIEAGAVQGLVSAAEKLTNAERGYRLCHDVKGDGHIETGRAWDYMRKCGDELRTALSQLAEASNA